VQISDYESNEYIIAMPENEDKFSLLRELGKEMEERRVEYIAERKRIISTMNIVSLKDHLKSLE
jgi:hypothetical protein